METIILNRIITDGEYSRSIVPFISPEYFTEILNRNIVKRIIAHCDKYKSVPTFDEIEIDIRDFYPENVSAPTIEKLSEIRNCEKDITSAKLLDETEKYFKNVAVQNAVIKCAEIIESNKTEEFGCFPELLKSALKVSFDSSVGINFKNPSDIRKRFEQYITRPDKIDLVNKVLNFITDGGYERKTLNVYMAPTNVGKTWKLIDDSCNLVRNGENVLYVTMEMSETNIMQRIETNFFQLPTSEFKYLTIEKYASLLRSVKPNSGKQLGNIVVKQLPIANVNHIDYLLDELELKQDFVPSVVIVDYIGIMQPVQKVFSSSYEKIKYISEELRGLAIKRNICIISAVQTNRSGFDSSDFGLGSVSESIGLLFTCDFVCAIIRDDDLDEVNEIWFKVLKNRYQPIKNKKFTMGTNILTQTFLEIEQNSGSDFTQEKIRDMSSGVKKNDFSSFKFNT